MMKISTDTGVVSITQNKTIPHEIKYCLEQHRNIEMDTIPGTTRNRNSN